MAQDLILKCKECDTPFVWTPAEQTLPTAVATDVAAETEDAAPATAPKPARCPPCRLLAPADGRQRGVVKWFSRAKGYGFITPVSGADIFVHKSALAAGQPLPCVGQLVEFSLGHGPRGAQAEALVMLDRTERDLACP